MWSRSFTCHPTEATIHPFRHHICIHVGLPKNMAKHCIFVFCLKSNKKKKLGMTWNCVTVSKYHPNLTHHRYRYAIWVSFLSTGTQRLKNQSHKNLPVEVQRMQRSGTLRGTRCHCDSGHVIPTDAYYWLSRASRDMPRWWRIWRFGPEQKKSRKLKRKTTLHHHRVSRRQL